MLNGFLAASKGKSGPIPQFSYAHVPVILREPEEGSGKMMEGLRSDLQHVFEIPFDSGSAKADHLLTNTFDLGTLYMLHIICVARLKHKLQLAIGWEDFITCKHGLWTAIGSDITQTPGVAAAMLKPARVLNPASKLASAATPLLMQNQYSELMVMEEIAGVLRYTLCSLKVSETVSKEQLAKETLLAQLLMSVTCDTLLVYTVMLESLPQIIPSSLSVGAVITSTHAHIRQTLALGAFITCLPYDLGSMHGLFDSCYPGFLSFASTILKQWSRDRDQWDLSSSSSLKGGSGDERERERERMRRAADAHGLLYYLGKTLHRAVTIGNSADKVVIRHHPQDPLKILMEASGLILALHAENTQLSAPAPFLLLSPSSQQELGGPSPYHSGTIWVPDAFTAGPAPLAQSIAAALQVLTGMQHAAAMYEWGATCCVSCCVALSKVLSNLLYRDPLAEKLRSSGFENVDPAVVQSVICTCSSALWTGGYCLLYAHSCFKEVVGAWNQHASSCPSWLQDLFHLCTASSLHLLHLAFQSLLLLPTATWHTPSLLFNSSKKTSRSNSSTCSNCCLPEELTLLYQAACHARVQLLTTGVVSLSRLHSTAQVMQKKNILGLFAPGQRSAPVVLTAMEKKLAQGCVSLSLQPSVTSLIVALEDGASGFYLDSSLMGQTTSLFPSLPSPSEFLDRIIAKELQHLTFFSQLLELGAEEKLSDEVLSLLLDVEVTPGYIALHKMAPFKRNFLFKKAEALEEQRNNSSSNSTNSSRSVGGRAANTGDVTCKVLKKKKDNAALLVYDILPFHQAVCVLLREMHEQKQLQGSSDSKGVYDSHPKGKRSSQQEGGFHLEGIHIKHYLQQDFPYLATVYKKADGMIKSTGVCSVGALTDVQKLLEPGAPDFHTVAGMWEGTAVPVASTVIQKSKPGAAAAAVAAAVQVKVVDLAKGLQEKRKCPYAAMSASERFTESGRRAKGLQERAMDVLQNSRPALHLAIQQCRQTWPAC